MIQQKVLGIAYLPILIVFAGFIFRIPLPPDWPMFIIGLFISSTYTSALIGGLICLFASMQELGDDWWRGSYFNLGVSTLIGVFFGLAAFTLGGNYLITVIVSIGIFTFSLLMMG